MIYFAMLQILKMQHKEAEGIVRHSSSFDNIMLQCISIVRRIRRTNTQKTLVFPKVWHIICTIHTLCNNVY